MRYGEALGQNGAAVRAERELRPAGSGASAVKEIPYDYAVKFNLKGVPGNREQGVINISTEGAFVALSIGYSFIPAPLPNRDGELQAVRDTMAMHSVILGKLGGDVFTDPRMLLQCHLVRLCGIHFKYSIVDSGSGRELQNQAIHNIAGLGEPNGERPFRPLAKPMVFQPRSSIRIEVEEVAFVSSVYVGAELFIVLHGYKVLGWGSALP
jgi:hypothetical protein